MTGGERGSPRFAPGKRGGGRGEALTQVRGHSGGGASINCPGAKEDFKAAPSCPGWFLFGVFSYYVVSVSLAPYYVLTYICRAKIAMAHSKHDLKTFVVPRVKPCENSGIM